MQDADGSSWLQSIHHRAQLRWCGGGGNTSGEMYLRGEKKTPGVVCERERGMRLYDANSSTDPKVIKEGVGRGASGAVVEITLQSLEKTMVKKSWR